MGSETARRPGSRVPRWTAGATAAVVVAALVQVSVLASPAHAAPGCPAELANDAAASAAARGCGGRVEVTARRSGTTQVWANPDGSYTAQVYAGPVRMRDAKGNWEAVDLSLRANADGSVTPKAHPNGLRLSGAAGAGTHQVVSVTAKGHTIGLGWDGALPKPVLSGNVATYPNVRPGVDLVVTATRTGYEESLVVKDRGGVDSVALISLPLQAADLAMSRDAMGNLTFRDSSGVVVGTSGAPEMFDAARDQRGQPVHRSTVPSRGGPLSSGAQPNAAGAATGSGDLVLSPDMSYLRDASRQFPVTIDPTINPLDTSADTYIKSNDTVDRSGATDIELGTYGGAGGGGPWPDHLADR